MFQEPLEYYWEELQPVLAFLADHPGVSTSWIAQHLSGTGYQRNSMRWVMMVLEFLDMAENCGGGVSKWYLTPFGAEYLQGHRQYRTRTERKIWHFFRRAHRSTASHGHGGSNSGPRSTIPA